jgi:hypothetical protein
MPSLRTLALLAVALGLILAAPAAGGAAQNSVPPAEAAGDGAPQVIPSIVNTRIARAHAALQRASSYMDGKQVTKVAAALNVARANGTYAWNAAKYVIKTTPPTPAGDVVPDGTGAGGALYAGPEDTAFAVLSLQHDVVSTVVGLMTQANAKSPSLRRSWLNAIVSSQATRNAAVAFIHSRKPPGPTWVTVMPNVVPLVNDELKDLNGRMKMTGFTGTLHRSLVKARKRAIKTRTLVNKYWPPAPAD